MATGRRSTFPKTFVLEFFRDDEDGCALTARGNDERFHIVVDPGKLDGTTLEEYQRRLTAVKAADARENGAGDVDTDVVRCVCGASRDDEGLAMIACDQCQVWQHNVCMDVRVRDEEAKDMAYFCEQCKPEQHAALLAVIEKEEKPRKRRKRMRSARNGSSTSMKVSKTNSTYRDSGVCIDYDDIAESELQLQNWILSCFREMVERCATRPSTPRKLSLRDWYDAPAHFFVLESRDGSLVPQEIQESTELRKRLEALLPSVTVPKYIRSLLIPSIDAATISVLAASNSIDPVHPSLVEHEGKEYFFKPVDPTQPQPTKREIFLLHRIQKIGLAEKINVPQVHGLVSSNNNKNSIMGMLLTRIDDPMPLTTLMDSEVAQCKRAKWAKESERIVELLHEHGIIWGDAKGDNFVVDKNGDLWIIDFGGSYTEGWVEPELMETQEGDEAGLRKIVDALDDPDGNTFDPNEAANASSVGDRARKRRNNEEGGSDSKGSRQESDFSKRAKR